MSDDGADLGIGPERALETVLGAKEQPEEKEHRTPAELAAYLMEAPATAETYDDAGRCAGKIILEYLRLHPEDGRLPATGEYHFPNDSVEGMVLISPGIDEQMKAKEPELRAKLSEIDLTGFLFGWAVNAAKYALDLPPIANPAIVTIAS